MATREVTSAEWQAFPEAKDFSIILGGPFFQLLRRFHLTGNALELLKVRLLVITLLAWLPFLVFSVIQKQAWGDNLALPFIEDIETHARFLVAIPIMVVAELLVHQRMRIVVEQFEARKLIPDNSKARFRNAIASAYRLRNAYWAEIFIVALIYVIGYNVVWEKTMAVSTTAWYADTTQQGIGLSWAGLWFRYVSLPLFQFLFLRWYYRLFIWARFLWQVSKIRLNLEPSHSDEVGGLGFLSNTFYTLMPLALMHGVVLAGMIANHIFHEGHTLTDYNVAVIVMVVIIQCIVILPLLVFSSQLSEVKRSASLEYGRLVAGSVEEYEAKWLQQSDSSAPSESIAPVFFEAQNNYKNVVAMSIVPVTRQDFLVLAVSTVLPLVPLLLTMMPLSDIVKLVARMLF